VFYLTAYPRLITEYVKTGKVRVVHRDFPLSQHPYAKLAARYANAAGELGHYDEVVNQLFETQNEWAPNGNVDAAVARVLPAETIEKVRVLVKNDPNLDETVAQDMAIVAKDEIHQTPTIVVVHKGTREKVAGGPTYELLRRYLDETLKK
jgi:protein-disulfide isomerase